MFAELNFEFFTEIKLEFFFISFNAKKPVLLFCNFKKKIYSMGVDPNNFESSLKAQTLLPSWFFLSSVNRISRVSVFFLGILSAPFYYKFMACLL